MNKSSKKSSKSRPRTRKRSCKSYGIRKYRNKHKSSQKKRKSRRRYIGGVITKVLYKINGARIYANTLFSNFAIQRYNENNEFYKPGNRIKVGSTPMKIIGVTVENIKNEESLVFQVGPLSQSERNKYKEDNPDTDSETEDNE